MESNEDTENEEMEKATKKKKLKKNVKIKMKICYAGCLTDNFDCCALKLIIN